ncbi:hypothetical protein BDK51DRAFT_46156 [Blyttiomyces helicus]|uniref:Uncharacterized protein n=1 Tax=Blyttiomyces helicus TaxID=388810 RepID=A0A4P9WNH2_9FUNG|nr:hypothetical protein BDK51DRAFT_46156 [Blyttiomyces helicus]|eukprot:RKO93825.1 hypothetical protein BDK51DRAFT_46156 [Blyttiomyces helicus]
MSETTGPFLEETADSLKLQIADVNAAAVSFEIQSAAARSELHKFLTLTKEATGADESKALPKAKQAKVEVNPVEEGRKEPGADRLQQAECGDKQHGYVETRFVVSAFEETDMRGRALARSIQDPAL